MYQHLLKRLSMTSMDVWTPQSLSTSEAGCDDLYVVLSAGSVAAMVSWFNDYKLITVSLHW